MPARAQLIVAPTVLAAAGLAALLWWFTSEPAEQVSVRVPREHARPKAQARAEGPQNPGTLTPGPGRPSDLPGVWPQFRGPDRTGVAPNPPQLSRSWSESAPEVLWRLDVGEGHAAPVVRDGSIYIVDYDRERQEDAIRCLSLADASDIWRYSYSVRIKRNHGMSRTIPAVQDGFVIALGPKGHVTCLRSDSGERVWQFDMSEDFGTEVPPWYAGQCTLIDSGLAVLAPGADPLMMGVRPATGDIVWRAQNPGGWGMTHSSIAVLDHPGARQYVYCTTRGVVGVDGWDGRVLWKHPEWKITLANVPTPLMVGRERVFVSGGYNSGCAMLGVVLEDDDWRVEELWRLPHTVFGSDQQTPILYGEHIYGVAPGGQLACISLEGERLWQSGVANGFGLGPYLIADGLILVLGDMDGILRLVEATPEGYRELGSFQALSGHDAWGPMALAGDLLLLRDATELVCLRLPTEE